MTRAVLIFLAFASAAASNCHGDECHDETSFVQVKTSVQVNRGHPEDVGDIRDAIQQEVEEGKRELRAYAEGLQDADDGEPDESDDTPQDYDEAGTEASRSLINARGKAYQIYDAFGAEVWPDTPVKVPDACLKDDYSSLAAGMKLADCASNTDASPVLPCTKCLNNQWAFKSGKTAGAEAGTGYACCSGLAKG